MTIDLHTTYNANLILDLHTTYNIMILGASIQSLAFQLGHRES